MFGLSRSGALRASSVLRTATSTALLSTMKRATLTTTVANGSGTGNGAAAPVSDAASLSEQLMALLDRKSSVTTASKYNKRAIRTALPEEDEDDENNEEKEIEKFKSRGNQSSANAHELRSYDDAFNAYLKNAWPNRDFASTWTLALPAKKHVRAYGLCHWNDIEAFGIDRTMYLTFAVPFAHVNRWCLINLKKKVIGFFEQDAVQGAISAREPDIITQTEYAFGYRDVLFDIHTLPLDWVMAFKRMRWPSIALSLTHSNEHADDILEGQGPVSKVLRPPRPPRTHPQLFHVKVPPPTFLQASARANRARQD